MYRSRVFGHSFEAVSGRGSRDLVFFEGLTGRLIAMALNNQGIPRGETPAPSGEGLDAAGASWQAGADHGPRSALRIPRLCTRAFEEGRASPRAGLTAKGKAAPKARQSGYNGFQEAK